MYANPITATMRIRGLPLRRLSYRRRVLHTILGGGFAPFSIIIITTNVSLRPIKPLDRGFPLMVPGALLVEWELVMLRL